MFHLLAPALVIALLTGCTFLSDTDLSSAETVQNRQPVELYEECDGNTIRCEDGAECIRVVDEDIVLTAFCSVECAPSATRADVCPDLDGSQGQCVLGFVGDESPQRCALTCQRDQLGTAEGCPANKVCTMAQGVALCL